MSHVLIKSICGQVWTLETKGEGVFGLKYPSTNSYLPVKEPLNYEMQKNHQASMLRLHILQKLSGTPLVVNIGFFLDSNNHKMCCQSSLCYWRVQLLKGTVGMPFFTVFLIKLLLFKS